MVNINKLKGKMVEKGLSMQEVAKLLGVDRATLYRKLSNNAETMLVKEANALMEILELTPDEATAIFFYPKCCIGCNI